MPLHSSFRIISTSFYSACRQAARFRSIVFLGARSPLFLKRLTGLLLDSFSRRIADTRETFIRISFLQHGRLSAAGGADFCRGAANIPDTPKATAYPSFLMKSPHFFFNMCMNMARISFLEEIKIDMEFAVLWSFCSTDAAIGPQISIVFSAACATDRDNWPVSFWNSLLYCFKKTCVKVDWPILFYNEVGGDKNTFWSVEYTVTTSYSDATGSR